MKNDRKIKPLDSLDVKIFADGADKIGIESMVKNPIIKGFTTNPTLMKLAGVTDYEKYAKELLEIIDGKPISFEVFSDDLNEMKRQASKIAKWGENVFVKVPFCNTKGESTARIIRELGDEGVKLNVTAIMTLKEVVTVTLALNENVPAFVSVFAGRIADTGVDPLPLMISSVEVLKLRPKAELIWASTRQALNIYQANDIGCQVITVPNSILNKVSLVGKDLADYSLEAVKIFYDDSLKSGFSL